MERCLNGDPDHSCHVGGCAGGPPALVPCREPPHQDSHPRQRLALSSVLSHPSAASPSKGSAVSAVLPANILPAHPHTHLSVHPPWASLPCGTSQRGAKRPHVLAWPQLSLPLPCPSAPELAVFLPADDADGHFHERDRHQRCGARYSQAPQCAACAGSWVGFLQGLFPKSIPRGCQPLPSLLPPARAGSPGPGGAQSWSRHPSPKPRGADGSESRQPRLLPPPDWRGRGEPGDTRQEDGSRAC